jgi:hypothetical protein
MEIRNIRNDLFFSEVADRIATGERVRIRAIGNSMLPFIRDNKDLIVLEKPNPRSFRKGRLLLVQMTDGRYVLHRVKKTANNSLVLHGDGNLHLFETCAPENVIAEATEVVRNGKPVKKGSFQWNLYRYLWPENLFLRRICLALYRRISFLQ